MSEIILSDSNGRQVIWLPDSARPLQMRKNGKTIFSAAAKDINEWADATDYQRARAVTMHRCAGREIADKANTLLAYCPPDVMTITTPDVVARLRELLPEARRLAEERDNERRREADRREAEFAKRRDEVIANCPTDCEPCAKGRWFDGIQTYIAPDGTEFDLWDGADDHGCGIVYVKREIVDAGRKHQAAERAAEEKRNIAKAEADAHRADCIRRARETGERVEIRHYTTDCQDPREECSLDIAREWAMPDGTITTTYQHTW